jgi:hypothetical protein
VKPPQLVGVKIVIKPKSKNGVRKDRRLQLKKLKSDTLLAFSQLVKRFRYLGKGL